MRVLFLDPLGTLGGAERMVLDLIAAIRILAPDAATGLIVAGDGPLVEEAAALGATVQLLPLPEQWAVIGDSALSGGGIGKLAALASQAAVGVGTLAPYLARLRRAIRDFRPGVVHTHGMKMHLLGAIVAPAGVPLVWHMHDFLGRRRLMSRALRAAAHRVDGVLANSRAVADDARNVLARKQVTVAYNAIDTDTFTPGGDVADLDALAGVPAAPSGTLRVGLVATYARWKGHDVFLDAAARVVRASPVPVRFYIVGGEVYHSARSQFTQAELRDMTRKRSISEHVVFVPFQRNPERVFRALDVMVHASTLPEPFGRTIVEAMACECAVVAADEGGAAELVTAGVDALSVRPRDPVSLADACMSLLRDHELRSRLGAQGRATAVRRFSRVRLGREVLDEYARLGVR